MWLGRSPLLETDVALLERDVALVEINVALVEMNVSFAEMNVSLATLNVSLAEISVAKDISLTFELAEVGYGLGVDTRPDETVAGTQGIHTNLPALNPAVVITSRRIKRSGRDGPCFSVITHIAAASATHPNQKWPPAV